MQCVCVSVCLCVCAYMCVCKCVHVCALVRMCVCMWYLATQSKLHTTYNTFLVTTDTPPGIASTLQEYQSWTPEMQNTDYSTTPISYVAPVSPIGSPTIIV